MWPALKEGSVVSCLLEPLKSLLEAGLYHLASHSIKPGVEDVPQFDLILDLIPSTT